MATLNSLPVKFDDVTACSKILYSGIEGGEVYKVSLMIILELPCGSRVTFSCFTLFFLTCRTCSVCESTDKLENQITECQS